MIELYPLYFALLESETVRRMYGVMRRSADHAATAGLTLEPVTAVLMRSQHHEHTEHNMNILADAQ